jgi:hypothetical protein
LEEYMKRIAIVLRRMSALLAGVGTPAAIDRKQIEREVMAVLDAFYEAFNGQDARAEERTYHFPHYRLASGRMAVFDSPGANTEAWMNGTYKTLTKEDGRWGIKMRSSFETLIK